MINNINSFCFYNPYNNCFYYAQLVDNRFIDNINNNHIHNYIWNELNGVTDRNFNSDIYGIPRQFFNYIIGKSCNLKICYRFPSKITIFLEAHI